ncbi:MAG: HAMP domain-containing histidine kinase [Deltaproteobacteria bacterium]|nr:HAMP domain-containing histidine kinase [Deltaproteobacteria bacterium]
MTPPEKPLGDDGGLQFFGRISASISHELKNALAVVNEISGLLDDLTALSVKKKKPPDLDRFASLSKRIGDQVDRADGIVKRLNKFSHTIDEQAKLVDVAEAVDFLCALCGRFADQKMVELVKEPPNKPPQVETNLFGFLLVMFLLVDRAMDLAGKNGKVHLAVRPVDGGAGVDISGTWQQPFDLAPENRDTLKTWQGRLGMTVGGLGEKSAVTIVWPPRPPL